jgi:hypothetical protein
METTDNVIDIDSAKRAEKNARRRELRAAKKSHDTGFKPVEHNFRKGTKRAACFALLNRPQGATLVEGGKATSWGHNVVLSEYYEIAKLCSVNIDRQGIHYHLKAK